MFHAYSADDGHRALQISSLEWKMAGRRRACKVPRERTLRGNNEVRESQVVSLWLDLLDPASSNLPLVGGPAFPERFAVD